MNRTELRDALTGLYNHTDDPRLIEEIRKVVEKLAGHSSASSAPSDAAIETVWTAAFIVACNIVIKRQNDLNDDDGQVDILNEQGAIISALKKWLVPDAVYLEELRGMLGAAGEPFQSRVQPWMIACFGEEISRDVAERNHRFLEEALELVQSTGCTASEAHQLVDYVFNRPTGETHQEIGGVMVTLAELCLAIGQDMHAAGEAELARIWTKVEKIRAKQAAKPKHSPLPQHVEASALPADVVRLVIAARIVAFEDQSKDALNELDKASEAFAERMPWDDEPRDETAEAVA